MQYDIGSVCMSRFIVSSVNFSSASIAMYYSIIILLLICTNAQT